MPWYAHSTEDQAKADWQSLAEHCLGVAVLAAEMAKLLGLERAAFFAGLFHDLGKYCMDFQHRLEGKDVRVDHSTAGAQVLLALAQGPDKLVAHLIAYAILGHHAGLPDWLNETDACCDTRLKRPLALDPAWKEELNPEISGLLPDMVAHFPKTSPERAFAFAFMTRMLFSCLVDAEAWIETPVWDWSARRVASRLLAEAWIETFRSDPMEIRASSPPCGGVD